MKPQQPQEGKLSPLQLGAYLPEHQEGLARLAQVVQRDGTPALVQLHHAGSHTDLESTGGLPLRSPSGVPVRGTPSRPLEEEEIWQLVDAFVRSAEMVLSAGFAGVEIHAAHGYLISQFLSPLTNKRTDSWGGTFEGRTKFLREVILRCKEIKKPEQILAMRLGLADWRQGGLEVEEGIEIARLARELGVELLDISFAVPGRAQGIQQPPGPGCQGQGGRAGACGRSRGNYQTPKGAAGLEKGNGRSCSCRQGDAGRPCLGQESHRP